MNAEQYRKANQVAYIICLAVIAAGLVLTILDIVLNGSSILKLLLISCAILCGGLASAGNFRHTTEKTGTALIMIAEIIFYLVLIIVHNNVVYFAFALPVLVYSILFLNENLARLGIDAIFVSLVIFGINSYRLTHSVSYEFIVAAVTLVLISVSCLYSIRLSNRFNSENNEELNTNLEHYEEVNGQLTEAVSSITNLLNESEENLEELREIMNAQHSRIKEIAGLTQESSSNLGVKTPSLKAIANKLSVADEHQKALSDAHEGVLKTVADCVSSVEKIKNNISGGDDLSRSVLASVQNAVSQIADIQTVTSIVSSVATRTNLIALSASIEASKAGEAGEGFANVANEIRNLGEEANKNSTEVNKIVNSLSEAIQNVSESIGEVLATMESHKDSLLFIQNSYAAIRNNMYSLQPSIEALDKDMDGLLEETVGMDANLQSMYAQNNQDVFTIVNDSSRAIEKAVEKFDETGSNLEKIFDEAGKLMGV